LAEPILKSATCSFSLIPYYEPYSTEYNEDLFLISGLYYINALTLIYEDLITI